MFNLICLFYQEFTLKSEYARVTVTCINCGGKTDLVGEGLCGYAGWSLLLFAAAASLHHHHSRVHVGGLQVNLGLLEHGAVTARLLQGNKNSDGTVGPNQYSRARN